MYAALDKQELLVYAQDAMPNQAYHCPRCQEPLFLKSSARGRPYFAHVTACGAKATNLRTGESDLHQAAKILLSRGQVDGKIEHWLAKSGQQVDVLLPPNRVLEYQQSKIPPQLLSHRNNDYLDQGLDPMWIGRAGDFSLKNLSRWQKYMVQYHANLGFHWWALDSKAKILKLYGHLPILYQADKWQVDYYYIPLVDGWYQDLDLTRIPWQSLHVKRKNSRQKMAYQIAIQKSDRHRQLLQDLAQVGIYLADAPNWIFQHNWKTFYLLGPCWVLLLLSWAYIKSQQDQIITADHLCQWIHDWQERTYLEVNPMPLVPHKSIRPLAQAVLACMAHYDQDLAKNVLCS
ncbi:TPA: competence protein CoiA family protein [Streptococcus suis]